MGILSWLFGSRSQAQSAPASAVFVSEPAFRENLARQMAMSPQTIAELRKHGVTESSKLRLEFFFYASIEDNAQQLAAALRDLGYHVEARIAAGDSRLFVVTGWTSPIGMDDESVVQWTERMVRLGYAHDSEFDGWGTNPQQ
jgi:regulator of RNase E activity RraB